MKFHAPLSLRLSVAWLALTGQFRSVHIDGATSEYVVALAGRPTLWLRRNERRRKQLRRDSLRRMRRERGAN